MNERRGAWPRRVLASVVAPVSERRRVVALASVGAVAVIVAATALLGGGAPHRTSAAPGPVPPSTDTPSAAPRSTTAPASTTTAPIPEPGLRFFPDDDVEGGPPAPLTGLRVGDAGVLGRPAVAVKVDNLDAPGSGVRPQVGLARADVVVEEVVEGGITRFVVVLHSTGAPEVGPVRSARTTDVDLLPAFGRPLFAYSGANPGTVAAVADAPSIIDLGGEWSPAYGRVGGRRRPHDLMVRPDELWARGRGGSPPGPLATFGPLDRPVPSGDPAVGVDLAFRGVAASSVSWRWSATHQRWLREQRGSLHVDSEGYAVGPRNVVVLVTHHRPGAADARSPEAVTVGAGEALVLTRGVVIRARWHRATPADRFTLTDGAGDEVPLTVGRTWIELAPPGVARVVV